MRSVAPERPAVGVVVRAERGRILAFRRVLPRWGGMDDPRPSAADARRRGIRLPLDDEPAPAAIERVGHLVELHVARLHHRLPLVEAPPVARHHVRAPGPPRKKK